MKIYRYPVLDSTNDKAKILAENDAEHGTVVIAGRQTSGRGQHGKDFFSPAGGLYISFILKADKMGFAGSTAVTAYAAVRTCEAIEEVCGINPSIKWVNDILINEKKTGGILTEGIVKNGKVGTIILGIGLNIDAKPEEFPAEIKNKAGSIYPQASLPDIKEKLTGELIHRVLCFDFIDQKELFIQYKKRLSTLNKLITVTQAKESYEAAALDIDEEYRLIVRTAEGEIKTLISAAVTQH